MVTYGWIAVALTYYLTTTGIDGSFHNINVRDVRLEEEAHPDQLEMMLDTHEGPLSLRLKRNPNVNMDFETYSAENGEIKREAPSASNVALYTDKRSQASIAVTSVKRNGQQLYKRSLSGSFMMNGAEYLIEPDDDDDNDEAHQPENKRSLSHADGDDDDDHHPEDKREVVHKITRREVRSVVNDHGSIAVEKREELLEHIVNKRTVLRAKRGGKPVFGIEVLVGVDYGVYKRWQERVGDKAENALKKYYALMMNGMDMRYDAIEDSSFKIFVRLAGIIFAKGPSEMPWTDPKAEPAKVGNRKMVDASASLKRIREFDRDPDTTAKIPKHDHLMVFTDYDIYLGNYNMDVAGLAYARAMCGTSSQSIVEDHGGFTSIGVATHELGHSLGAEDHDGEGSAETCGADEQNIMTAVSGGLTEATQENPFKFSKCSIAQMKKYLIEEKHGSKCLSEKTSHSNDAEFQEHINKPAGQLYGPDDQCKQVHGPTSFYCAGNEFDKQICRSLWCFEPTKKVCISSGGAVYGTTCGNKKWCSKGLCVSDKNAPEADDTCVHGDYKVPFSGGKTCLTFTEKSGNFCYSAANSKLCCGSCKKHETDIPGCKYGNKAAACTPAYCPTYKSFCCKTCHK